MSKKRKSGVLLHITSLPGPYGIGTMGKEAMEFVDFLAKAGQKIWQILPLGPTGYGDSPYQSFSTFAGNPLLINLELLTEKGWLHPADLQDAPGNDKFVDFGPVIQFKFKVMEQAYRGFQESANRNEKLRFGQFCEEKKHWLTDYALFMALKAAHSGKPWYQWDAPYKMRHPEAIKQFGSENSASVDYWKFLQYVFFTQWESLKDYTNAKGIEIVGDIPIFIAHDSADACPARRSSNSTVNAILRM